MGKAIEMDDEDLLFLDRYLQSILDGMEHARDRTIEDKSLKIRELLQIDISYVDDINRCAQLIGRLQREIDVRGIVRG
jgi:D-ribose pyranose/furanose isomerase RbsD